MTQPQPQTHTGQTLKAALEYLAAGVCVIPAMTDGSKRPIGTWKKYQTELSTLDDIVGWFSNPQATGIGIITGHISGNLEMTELEGRAVADGIIDQAKEIAYNSGLENVWDKLANGYVETTPSGGVHWLYRIEGEVPGNTKLARRPGDNGGVEVLAETRGEGGFVVTAPSHGTVHETGKPWQRIAGNPATIPTLSLEERDAFHTILKSFDTMPTAETVAASVKPKDTFGDTLTPGDDYNNRANWADILIGWTQVYTSAGVTYWRRPGKTVGISATTGRNDGNNLYVFTTSTDFESEKPYSKFAAYTHLNHSGDYSAAAKTLRRNGFGTITPVNTNPIQPLQLVPTNTQNNTNTETDTETDEPNPEQLRRQMAIDMEAETLRIRKAAKQLVENEEHNRTFRTITYTPNLTEELQIPDEETAWAIEQLMPAGSNVLLTAAYKSGKTTMINHLVKCIADNQPFLNKYHTTPQGQTVIFNYEVEPRQYRDWLRQTNINNPNKVTLINLRGLRLPLTSPKIEDYVVNILTELNCETWVIDPFARAFVGSGDENSNSDVGVFLDTLDIIKDRAGVKNLVMPAHTGRNQEHGIDRARGATRLDDWADVRWLLSKRKDTGERFFSATGRDVELEEGLLTYQADTRSLEFNAGIGKRERSENDLENAIINTIADLEGINTEALHKAVGGNKIVFLRVRDNLVNSGKIVVEDGPRNSKKHRTAGFKAWKTGNF